MPDGATLVRGTFASLSPRERRRAVIRSLLWSALAAALLVGVYFALPVDDDEGGMRALAQLVLGLAAFLAVMVWQVRRILHADHPHLQAVRALSISLPLFLLVFASVYLAVSASDPQSFSEELDHVGALYLTITTFSTVGFGDITPETDLARMLVSAQMLLDLVALGALAKVLLGAARLGLARRSEDTPTDG